MKRSLYRWHSWLALAACIPLIIVCITGSILVFKPELDRLLGPERETLPEQYLQQRPARLSFDQLFTSISAQLPNYEVAGWEVFDDHHQADRIYVIKHGSNDWSKAHLDPYSGKLLSQPVGRGHYLTDWLLQLHYTFLLHDIGLVAAAVVALILAFLGISGLILYRNLYREFFKSLIHVRWHKRRQLWLMDIHKCVGSIASPVLLILAITGGYWNIAHYLHELEEHADGAEHHTVTGPLFDRSLSLDTMQKATEQLIPGFSLSFFRLPHEPGAKFNFLGYVDDKSFVTSRYSSSVTFAPDTGTTEQVNSSRDAGFLYLFIDSFRELHFGSFGGISSRVLWCILGAAPLLLAITGSYVWLSRRYARRRKSVEKSRSAFSTN